ncbi:hypothetical protein [Streptomyces sp. NBC_01363]|uniref:hypothetical protein n=1 Tax=Streptomyces sp. NBC_01363 TaxID=2903840 RepID=UPI002250B08E|nr:hypothetical protein [Streptomyces sp. NBC_01363]MCX4735813.1 hypothetical protein [Streptomyces sp. NBC_01363]
MTEHQCAGEVREFTQYLRDVVALLDPGSGWYGIFCRRDPAGMRACLDGTEIPPWDVMESLLQDLAARRGTAFAQHESVRGAELYSASVAAHDRRAGGRQMLVERLELMLREQTHAARRLRAAGAGGTAPDLEVVAWARDDHERATARCSELRARLAAISAPKGWFRTEEPGRAGEAEPVHGDPSDAEGAARVEAAAPERGPEVTLPAPRPPAARRGKPRGARFAGLDADDTDGVPAVTAPVLPVPPATAGVPRGARFAAAPADDASAAPARAAAPDPEARRAATAVVERLIRLRAGGRSGEAHVVLCEAAGRPADRLPVLAVELHRAGLDADWATLLWEVSSLPPTELAAAAAALSAAGRPDDCAQLLRQSVARPAGEIADAVVALERAGHGAQAQALLGAFIRVRTPQDAARVAAGDPPRLVPRLLAAARAVSPARERDVVHALRVAGIANPA